MSCARITPARELTEVAAEEVHGWIVANTPPNAEAVVVAGNGLRAVGAIDALEASLERPVITANQAMLWKGLNVAGVTSHIDQYGRLFKLGQAAAAPLSTSRKCVACCLTMRCNGRRLSSLRLHVSQAARHPCVAADRGR